MKHVFLSYSRIDTEIMRRIATFLRSKGLTIWTDENLIPGTRNWKTAIETAIEEAGAVVVILSPDAKASEWVDREVEYARIRDVRIFPLIVRGDPQNAIPLELVTSQWIDIKTRENYVTGMEKLLLALDSHLGVRRKSRAEQLKEELIAIFNRLPNPSYIALITVDGLSVAYHSVEQIEEDVVTAMNIAQLAFGERISSEVQNGEYLYSVIRGRSGLALNIVLGEDYCLGIGLKDFTSIETALVILKQWWKPLLAIEQIPEPAI